MKIKVILSICILFALFQSSTYSITENVFVEWEKTYGGTGDDYANSAQQTSDGGYIISGYVSDLYNYPIKMNIYLLKVDPNGNKMWEKTYGGDGLDFGSCVQQTTDGGYIIAGRTSSFGSGRDDVYLIKTDSEGKQLWQKTFGGPGLEYGQYVQQTSDGGYIITGETESFGAGKRDCYLIKTDSNGNLMWEKTFGGADYDYGYCVQETLDGGYIISGDAKSFGNGNSEIYLLKTDPNGNLEWNKTYGDMQCHYVRQTPDGGYIVTGATYSQAVVLIRTDSNGKELWKKYFGQKDWNFGRSIQITNDGGFLISGYTDNYGNGEEDAYIIKTDSNGNLLWEKTFGGNADDYATYGQQTTDGGYFIAGGTRSYGAGRSDIYLLKLGVDSNPVEKPHIIYVDDDANGVNDGTSWENAYNYLQDALTNSKTIPKAVEIRVAKGTYQPDRGANQTPGDREASFELINGVSLTGGFAGVGRSDPNERNIELYETILSGDLNYDDIVLDDPCSLLNEPSRTDNSRHVIYSRYSDMTAVIDGFTVTSGNANGSPYNYFTGGGGGMYIFYGKPSIANCTFKMNAAYNGGGTYSNCGTFIFDGPKVLYNNPRFNDCTFINNFAENGGAMYNYDSNSIVNSCTFSENIATEDGGGIYNDFFTDSNITNCTFSRNKAKSGGGINISTSYSTINNCTFNENEAEYGGGIKNTGIPIITNCIFNKNKAKFGGGGIRNTLANPSLTNCIFSENTTEGNGGGINNLSSNPKVLNCIFSGNTAEENGGGIYNYKGSNVVTNCIFKRNFSKEFGGGVYNSPLSNTTIKNCLFCINTAGNKGDGVSIWGSNTQLINCTFAGNTTTYGSTISCFSEGNQLTGIVDITNCILWDDNEPIYNSSNLIINISYCDIKSNQENLYDPNETINWGEGNINIDPCFVEPGYWDTNDTPNDSDDDFWVDGDYHLKSEAGRFDPNSENWIQDNATSPCIDAGDPNSPVYYEMFFNGGRINMGAYGGTEQASISLNDITVLEQASLPNPPDNAAEVLLDVTPGWISDLDAMMYEIYFGKTEKPEFIQKQYELIYDPGPLEPNTQYYWRVDSIDNFQNRTTGNTWTFKTGFFPAHIFYLSPSNGAIDEDVKTNLSWFHGLNSINYNVYFGTDFNDVNNATVTNPLNVLVAENLETNSYYPGTLEYDQLYFWRIDEKDSNGIVTKGDVWSFVTMSKPLR